LDLREIDWLWNGENNMMRDYFFYVYSNVARKFKVMETETYAVET